MEYERDIFYDVRSLSIEERIKILDAAKAAAKYCWVDKLDCSISTSRQRTDMTYEEVMRKFDDECHFVVIHRRGYKGQEQTGEIGFCTMMGISHYLWLITSVEDLNAIVEIHKLKPMGS